MKKKFLKGDLAFFGLLFIIVFGTAIICWATDVPYMARLISGIGLGILIAAMTIKRFWQQRDDSSIIWDDNWRKMRKKLKPR